MSKIKIEPFKIEGLKQRTKFYISNGNIYVSVGKGLFAPIRLELNKFFA